MDRANLRNMHRICSGDFGGKMHLLMDYTDHPGDVADPWYTDDFESTWQDVLAECYRLLDVRHKQDYERSTPDVRQTKKTKRDTLR